MPAGLTAFAYLALLWCASPLTARRPALLERMRGTLLLGIAIPLTLAALHLFYAPALWLAAFALAAAGLRSARRADADEPALYAALAAAAIVMWPPLVRPLLDGDSLAYHLPNAVSWMQSHTLWNAAAPYWYYPPASEMFAAGLLQAGGRWSLPLAGALPALLLTARIYRTAREAAAPAYAAAPVALAFVCTPVAALQSGTLQNDLWLAAFFAEILCTQMPAAAFAVCALIKPTGFIEAIAAAAARRMPLRFALPGAIALLAWALRDGVLLLRGAGALAPQPPYWSSTIAGNALAALPQLLHGTLAATPQALIWIAALAAGFAVPSARRYAAAGGAALLLYAVLPVSYSNGATNYVQDASSLRYAMPALACGALVAARLCAIRPAAWSAGGYAAAAWGAYTVLAIFWNDAYTRYAPLAAAIAVAAALAPRSARRIPLTAAILAIVLTGAYGAASRAPGFYADWMRDARGGSTRAFAWIAQHRPARVVAENVRSGAVFMVSPSTVTLAAGSSGACALASKRHAVLFAGSNEDATPAQLREIFASARACGAVLYADGAGIVVAPRAISARTSSST